MALGGGTFSSLGAAAQDLFSADAHRARAAGGEFERQNYLRAAGLADENVRYTELSTAIQTAQKDRSLYQQIGGQQADVAGAGFAASGSALDLMADSARQGALQRAVLGEQGLITEEGYRVQGESYRNLASAAQVSIDAENRAADRAPLLAAVHGAAALASLIPGS